MRPDSRSLGLRAPWIRRALLALGGVAGFFFAVQALPHLPLREGRTPRRLSIPAFERPGPGTFFAQSAGNEVSQQVLFHDLGSSIENARRANIIFFGNSRMQLGLREETLVPAAEALGLRVFTFACGNSEKTRFALELFRRYDLRPKVVVASGGPDVFTEGVSDIAQRAMESTRWEAWRDFVEVQGAWAVQSRLHSWLPKLDVVGDELAASWIIYRSERTGWWLPVREPNLDTPAGRGEELASYEHLLPVSRELHAELGRRGALLVLTLVPYEDTLSGHLPFLADRLDVPVVLPSFGGMRLADGSHLTRESARTYAGAFWDLFLADPRVRERLQLQPEPTPSAPQRLSPIE